jgi:spermidine synthase
LAAWVVVGLLLCGCPRPATSDPDPAAPLETASPWQPPPQREAGKRVLFEQPSPYGQVLVVESGGRRCLKFSREGGDQSCVDLRDPNRVVHEYIRFLPVGLLFTPESPRTLMVGLGGGRAVKVLLDHDPALQMDVVEINPVVVEVAARYFDTAPSERLRIHVADGRSFFEGRSERWDMVMLDAFGNDFIPFHLTTAEYLRLLSQHLSPRGAVVANLWTRNDRLFRAMLKTYAAVFPRVYLFRAMHVGNAIVVATRRDDRPSCAEVAAQAGARADRWRFPFPFTEQPGRCEAVAGMKLDDVPVLTDAGRAEFDALGPL